MSLLKIVFMIVLFSNLAMAGDLSVPKKNFAVTVRGKYGTRWVKVYKDGSDWICNTEAVPYFVARGNPLKDFEWKKFQNFSDPGDCRDLVIIDDRLQTEHKTVKGCLDQTALKSLVNVLDERCRAE
jgi:hypothetical protein